MTTTIFYVLFESKLLKLDNSFSTGFNNVKTFTTEADAINHIDNNLANEEYTILKKVVKS